MMRSIVVVVFGLAAALWPRQGSAEGAFAIWLLNGNPSRGFAMGASVDKATVDEAQSAALTECRKQAEILRNGECKIVGTFRDQCFQDALNGDPRTPSTAVGWGVGPDRETANRRSMEMCKKMRRGTGRSCRLDGEPLCDGKAK